MHRDFPVAVGGDHQRTDRVRRLHVVEETVMGIGGKELLIILAIGLVIFGARRIRDIGEGLGQSIKDFRNHVREDDDDTTR